METIVTHWKTSVPGALLIISGIAEFFGVVPNGVSVTGSPIDLIMAGLGLLAAKDGDK